MFRFTFLQMFTWSTLRGAASCAMSLGAARGASDDSRKCMRGNGTCQQQAHVQRHKVVIMLSLAQPVGTGQPCKQGTFTDSICRIAVCA
jgi:hypothetical protein